MADSGFDARLARGRKMPMRALASALGIGAIALLAACGSSSTDSSNGSAGINPQASSSAVPEVTITAREYSYDAPATLPAGLVGLTLTNSGQKDHDFRFYQLVAGATLDQLQAALQAQDQAKFESLVAGRGGWDAAPGETHKVTVGFQAGQYLLTSLAGGRGGGKPDIAQGMKALISVSGTAPAGQQPPAVDGTLTMKDFSFDVPAGFGKGTFTVINAGVQSHEVLLNTLDPGKTLDDVKAYLRSAQSGPPSWAHAVAGMPEIAPGTTQWVTMNLPPGHYLMLCRVLDPATNAPHAAKGMIADFTIS